MPGFTFTPSSQPVRSVFRGKPLRKDETPFGFSVPFMCCSLNTELKYNPFLFQVTWSPPLIPNGEIHGYEIRLPEPRIFHNSSSSSNASELSVTVTGLVPYTNYSVSVLACSSGGAHVGGCTQSLPTAATTSPTSPQGLAPLLVVAISESFLAISWQPPSRPNGPNIR